LRRSIPRQCPKGKRGAPIEARPLRRDRISGIGLLFHRGQGLGLGARRFTAPASRSAKVPVCRRYSVEVDQRSDPTRTHTEIGQHAPDALTGYDLCLARQDARRSPYLCFIVQANRTLITRARIKVATTAAITPLAAQELPTGPADSWNRENPTSRSSFRAAVTISLLAASTISNTAEATSRTDRKTPPYRL
jgi:hypothetical protein